MSVPNQKVIIIHQSEKTPFLKIGKEEWMMAYKEIKTPSSFILYLYLASNKNEFNLELSRAAFKNATGLSKSSYHRAVDHLTQLGYIYEDNNGRLNFATTPKKGGKKAIQQWDTDDSEMEHPIAKNELGESQECNTTDSETNTEINNKEINNTNKTHMPFYETSWLKKYVLPNGQIQQGRYKGSWLNVLVKGFWDMDRGEQSRQIANKLGLSRGVASAITEQVLDKEEYLKTKQLFAQIAQTSDEEY